MTSYERVMKTLRHEEPDKVPIAELVISPLLYQRILPAASSVSEFYDYYDYDVVITAATYTKISQTADRGYTDEWRITYKTTDNGDTYHPIIHPMQNVRVLDNFSPPNSESPIRLGLLPEYVKKYKYKKAVAFSIRGGFLWASALMSMEDLLYAFYDDEEFVNALPEFHELRH